MWNKVLEKEQFIYCSIVLFIATKCAQVVPLTGGQKDLIPPKLVSFSPSNYTKNFSSEKIIFTFNEKIQLINPDNNIIIVPKISEPLEWKVKNKTLEIILPEKLEQNTTYKIILNKAIADITERNVTDNIEYVFSTGNFIDSLYIKGNVKNAYTLAPEKHVLVAIYENSKNDSVVLKEKPKYFTKTDEDGNYILKNLPRDNFRIVAFSDDNSNFSYDPIKEKIGFVEELVNTGRDSIINFLLSEEKPLKNNIKKYYVFNPHQIHIIYSYPDKYELVNQNNNILLMNDSLYSDTCKIMIRNIDTANLIIKNSTHIDTLFIPLNKQRKVVLEKYSLKNQLNGQQPFFLPIVLSSNFWIDSAEIKKQVFFYQDDTLHQIDIEKYIKVQPHQITINYPLQQNKTYILKIPSNKTDSKNGTIYQKFELKTNSIENYAQLKINVLFPDKKNYIVALCNVQHRIMYTKNISIPLSSSNQQSVEFKNIIPDTYILKIIQDSNQNYKWDTHQYPLDKSKRQFAEKVFVYPKPIKLINNWDVVLDWKEIK